MNIIAAEIWKLSLELAILLSLILVLRKIAHKTANDANTYVLWMSIPVCALVVFVLSLWKVPISTPVIYEYKALPLDLVAAEVKVNDWFWQGLVAAWFVIAVALLIRLVIRHLQLRNHLKMFCAHTSVGIVLDYPVVIVDQTLSSPATYGFVTPRIYLPKHLLSLLSQEQLALILEHEQVHIKQKHLWLNLVWDIAICVFWFNPIFTLARNRFRYDQEVYCDSMVLKERNSASREAYGLALISTAPKESPFGLMCSWQSFYQLEKRIINIKNPLHQRGKTSILACVFALSAVAAVYAADYDIIEVPETSIDQPRVSVHLFSNQQNYIDPDTQIDFTAVRNCSYLKDVGSPGVNGFVDKSECRIVENGKERAMTENELDTYLSILRKTNAQDSELQLISDTNVLGFDESAVIADLKSKNIPDELIDKIVANLNDKFNKVDGRFGLQIKSQFKPEE